MQRYDSYKDSGIQWLGQIPGHWEKRTLRSFIKLFTEKGYGNAQLLSVTRERGVIERNKDDKEENHNFVPEDLSGYKHIMPGDFVINKMKSWQGSYGVSAYEGIVSPAYFTCKLSNVEKDYFSLAIRSKAYVPFFTQYSKGIRVDQWDLDPIALMKIPFFLPPLAEQKSIVTYLDRETEKINSFISSKEKEIRLLDELKQAEIANAVTHGLNPNVTMKDSGIAWLGQIPRHWDRTRVYRIFKVIGSGTTPASGDSSFYTTDGTPWLQSGDFKNNVVLATSKKVSSLAIEKYNLKLYDKDSIVIAMYGASIGKVGYLGIPMTVNQACCVLGKSKLMDMHYAFYSFIAEKENLIQKSKGGTQPNISQEIIKSHILPIPPLPEQKEIVEYLDRKCANIDKMISNIEQEIEKLKEYKQRLIADAVTGQIKVC